jgi:heterodisulfide reductase subunit B
MVADFCIFVYMESILIHPENPEQLKTVKAVLKALKVQFESAPVTLPAHVSESIRRGISQFEAGKSISLEEFTQKHLSE